MRNMLVAKGDVLGRPVYIRKEKTNSGVKIYTSNYDDTERYGETCSIEGETFSDAQQAGDLDEMIEGAASALIDGHFVRAFNGALPIEVKKEFY